MNNLLINKANLSRCCKIGNFLVYVFVIHLFYSCVLKSTVNETNDNLQYIDFDVSTVKEKKILKIEDLVTDYEIVQLDNSDDALINIENPFSVISDNYIGIYSFNNFPFKLFDRNGAFIKNIGNIGNGAGEYIAITDAQIDELNNCVYLLPAYSNRIQVYDLTGTFLKSIKLPERVTHARFKVYTLEEQILIARHLDGETEKYIWLQDFEGNIIQFVDSKEYTPAQVSFENYILNSCHTDVFDVFQLYENNKDACLYHYNLDNNILEPIFSVANYSVKVISIYELPNHFFITPMLTWGELNNVPAIVVEKQNFDGYFFDGVLFPFGLIISESTFLGAMKNGFFTYIQFASKIRESIKFKKTEGLNTENQKYLNQFDTLADEKDDYSIIIMGKLK